MFELSELDDLIAGMDIDRNKVTESLSLLGELLAARKERPLHLVVSGGAALQAAEIIARSTNDVDVIAMRGEIDGEIIGAYSLPEFLKEEAGRVAEEMGLYPKWLNASTAFLMIDLNRFPGDFMSETVERNFGEFLRVTFIGRAGQIYLKMYAAVNRKEERDIDDLIALDLTPSEAERSSRWLIDEEIIDRLKIDAVGDVLRKIGHHEVISRAIGRSS